MTKNLFFQLAVGLIVGIALIVGVALIFNGPYQYQGSQIDPPIPAADFTLDSASGSFTLSEQRGKIVLLYFGYTRCPDVCPTTLYDFKSVKERMGEKASGLEFVMVTVDPERDDLTFLNEYITTFDPDFIGLTGDLDTLETIYSDYGIFRQKQEVGSAAGYLMDHTARVYVIDALGNLALTFPFGMEPEAMADDLLHLMKN